MKPGDTIVVSSAQLDGCRWHANAGTRADDVMVEAVVTDVRDMSYRSRKNNRGQPVERIVTFMTAICQRQSCGMPDHYKHGPHHTHNARESQVTIIGDLASPAGIEAFLSGETPAS